MLDEATRRELRVIAAQARATGDSLVKTGGDERFTQHDTAVHALNSLVARARAALQGTGFEQSLPSGVSASMGGASLSDLAIVASSLEAALAALLQEEDEEVASLKAERDLLKQKLMEAEVRSAAIVDDELEDRCSDLLLRPGKADTAVRDATVVLEDRIRRVTGLGRDHYGVALVDKALSPKTGMLELGKTQSEREGIHHLYRGVIAFFKNPASHRIIEDYDVTRARLVVGLIDLLLQLLRDAKKRETAAETGKSATS